MYYDDCDWKKTMEPERELRRTKRDLESRGYEVDRNGFFTPKSGRGSGGYIDSEGRVHHDM